MIYQGQRLLSYVAAEVRACREAFLNSGGDHEWLHGLITEVKSKLKSHPEEDHAYICNILWDTSCDDGAQAGVLTAMVDLITSLLRIPNNYPRGHTHYFAWIQAEHPELLKDAYPLPMGITAWGATAAAKRSPYYAEAFLQGRKDWLDYIESLILWDAYIPEVGE